MKCKQCGFENEGGYTCKNCKAPLYTFQVMWKGILMGLIAGFIVLTLVYMVYGKEGWFFFGLNFAVMISGMVATIFSKRENIKAVNDINYVLNSFLAGAIFYILSLPIYIFQFSFIIFILIIGYGMIGFLGGAVGYFINILREQKLRWKITGFLIIFLILSTITYGLFFSNFYNEKGYYTNLGQYCISDMYLVDATDNETTVNLNGTVVYDIKNQTLLKDTALRYQRMKNLTNNSLDSRPYIYCYASYSIQKDYLNSLDEYFKLRLDYYGELEKAANSTINGNRSQAIKHYKKAQKLVPKIKKQEIVFKNIENKDPNFKKRIDELIVDANRMVATTKKLGTWLTPEY